jgi:TATA-box binding protein (TBP) (component of TFIID and TFIIIB)
METPKLSTMVVLYNTNLKLDTTKLVEILPLSYGIIRAEKRGVLKKGESKRDKIKRRSKKESKSNNTGFGNNSMTLVMMNDGDGTMLNKEITIKIFQNGVFHMTGILDDAYDMSAMKLLLEIIWNDCHSCIQDCPETPEVIQRRVVLMNYTTKLSLENVPRQALYTSIRKLNIENIDVHYDPDVYPGVKIHIGPHKWIAKVFRTSKVILTGITTKQQCADFVEQLTTLLARTSLYIAPKPISDTAVSR